jgi:predicted Fe-Mo cluster-binding NifX family protein
MQRNKVYAVTVIAAVAKELGVGEDLLHEISIGMQPEDGVIWVHGIGEGAIMAFTDEGIEELKTPSKCIARTPTYSRNHRRRRPTADGYGAAGKP